MNHKYQQNVTVTATTIFFKWKVTSRKKCKNNHRMNDQYQLTAVSTWRLH